MNIKNLKQRAVIIRDIRTFFDERGFTEVATPLLSAEAIADRFVEPLVVNDSSLPRTPMFLQTSPELPMKRLLAEGMESIYQLGQVWRSGDRGSRHNVEFTMLEWYRVGDDYESGRLFLGEFLHSILGRGMPDERTFGKAFQEAVSLNPHTATVNELRAVANANNVVYPQSFSDADASVWVDLLFAELVEPYLGLETPTLLYDFPTYQSQLAKTRKDRLEDGSVFEIAQRYEIYVDGIELANGYDESFNANELKKRLAITNQQRSSDGHNPIPQDRFLEAMQSNIKQCCGCAVGIDRLLMIMLAAEKIDDVIVFPIETA
ncbi:MAG: EF-P lysine aminoacylase GenX [Planctomycetaceae bacterium]|jgi:lysyl-tRNA synthetase class 2|nr:EF-P lysine aminoacylase GenX [Planctomycetaceae bacterium]